jgi:DHA1 family bicyclomycin/chloramphenicol resistance-like MFS transporter
MSVPRDTAAPVAPRVHQRTWGLAGLIASLSMLGPFSIDLYLPAFPAIAQEFSASPIAMQQTLSAYLFAYGFMMLWHGALSDALGRRPIIIAGLAVYGFATLGCAIAGNIETLWLFRAAQGICAGTGLVIGRAIIRDRFQGTEAQRLMSQITLVFSIAPAVAPIIGGVLLNTLGWRSIFWVLLLWVLGMLVWSAKFLPETLHPSHRHALRPRVLWRNYAKVIANPEFTMLSLIPTLNFAAFFIYIAAAPAFLVDLLGVSTWGFAWLFLPMIAGVIAGAMLSGRMAGRYSPQRTIRIGYSLIAAGAVLNVLICQFAPPFVAWNVAPIMIYAAGSSLVAPSIMISLLDLFPTMRGMASSLQGFVQFTFSGVVAGTIAPLLARSLAGLAWGMAAFSVASFASWLIYQRHARTTLKGWRP